MMYKEILDKIKEEFMIDGNLHKRYYHTLGVIEMALTLNNIYHLNLDEKKVFLAAGFHDIAKLLDKSKLENILAKHFSKEFKELKDYPSIWHSFVGSIYAKEKYGILDEEVLSAIKYHTTGRPNMTALEKIVFVSDYIEKITRFEPSMIEARKTTFSDLDLGVEKVLLDTISYLKKENRPIYYLTNETYQYYSKGKMNV